MACYKIKSWQNAHIVPRPGPMGRQDSPGLHSSILISAFLMQDVKGKSRGYRRERGADSNCNMLFKHCK